MSYVNGQTDNQWEDPCGVGSGPSSLEACRTQTLAWDWLGLLFGGCIQLYTHGKQIMDLAVLVFTLKWCAGFWEGICLADIFWTWTSSCAKEDFKLTWVGRQPSQRSGRVSSEGWHDRWLSCRTLANCFPVSAAQWIVNDQASQDPFNFLCLYCHLQIWIPVECSSMTGSFRIYYIFPGFYWPQSHLIQSVLH